MTVGANVKSHSVGGHKEMSLEEQDRRSGGSITDNRDPEALMQNRVLSNSHVLRAALFDKNDVKQMAGSVQQFQMDDPKVRELLDGLLAVERQVEGSATTVTGGAPDSVEVEGAQYKWAEKSTGSAILAPNASDRHDLYLVQTALYFVVIEATGDRSAMKTFVDSFAEGLQSNAM